MRVVARALAGLRALLVRLLLTVTVVAWDWRRGGTPGAVVASPAPP